MTSLLDAYTDSVVEAFLAREPYKDLLMQRSPPGYPLGYIRERVEITCLCGEVARYSRLLVVERSASRGRKIRPCGKSEPVYDLEIAEVVARGGTPRCDLCFSLPREPVPEVHEQTGRKTAKELSLDDFMDISL